MSLGQAGVRVWHTRLILFQLPNRRGRTAPNYRAAAPYIYGLLLSTGEGVQSFFPEEASGIRFS